MQIGVLFELSTFFLFNTEDFYLLCIRLFWIVLFNSICLKNLLVSNSCEKLIRTSLATMLIQITSSIHVHPKFVGGVHHEPMFIRLASPSIKKGIVTFKIVRSVVHIQPVQSTGIDDHKLCRTYLRISSLT